MLPTPNLDDRRFQDIVDEARRLIPRYCPEWTDHNLSDPGITLIELFAWMMDMLLYRLNRVPDKNFVTFLDLIGVRLLPQVQQGRTSPSASLRHSRRWSLSRREPRWPRCAPRHRRLSPTPPTET